VRRSRGAGLALALGALACVSSPLGRQRLLLFPDAEIAQLGVASFERMKGELPVDRDPVLEARVRCVVAALTAPLERGAGGWEVVVFRSDEPNAFALPGRKIGVNSGIFRAARNPDQLATVLGHEIAHVLAQHANERISTAFAAQSGLELVGAMAGGPGPQQQQLLAMLGVGAQVGLLLPWSRDQEREADLIGLDLMADAGFDPRQSLELWRNLERLGGPQPPEFLSTHPASGTRMHELAARMPEALGRVEAARARGRLPQCGDR
jgi:predicted Zn-dependent protease